MCPQDSETVFIKDSEWKAIDGELCRVISFDPRASVQGGKVVAIGKTLPYASLTFECKKLPGIVRGLVTHKTDFSHLWAAFRERAISENEEVIVVWTAKRYRYKFLGTFSLAFPKLLVMICPKGAFELMTNPNWKPELTGEARAKAILPIAEWKLEIMR